MATRVYLDTWLFMELISKGEKRKHALRQVSKLRSNSFEAVIPQVVLGEAISTIMRDYDPTESQNHLVKLDNTLRDIADIKSCLPPITVKIIEKAKVLMEGDSNITDTDAVIVAQTLLDRASQKLLTDDKVLLTSKAIINEELRMRHDGQRDYKLVVADKL